MLGSKTFFEGGGTWQNIYIMPRQKREVDDYLLQSKKKSVLFQVLISDLYVSDRKFLHMNSSQKGVHVANCVANCVANHIPGCRPLG